MVVVVILPSLAVRLSDVGDIHADPGDPIRSVSKPALKPKYYLSDTSRSSTAPVSDILPTD